MKGVEKMKMWKTLAFTLAGMIVGASSFGGIGDSIMINFNADPGASDPFLLTNPAGFRNTPMVTLGGDAHYQNSWEVMTAWNPNPTNCPGVMGFCPLDDFFCCAWQNFANAGTGTITFDQVPSIPPGEYRVYFYFNIANWTKDKEIGFQFGGTGVTELGNEMPGEMHFFYPDTNNGQDTFNDIEIAGPHMGTSGTHYLWYGPMSNQDPGEPLTMSPPHGSGICGQPPFFEDPCLPIPTGSDPNGNNDGSSFPTSILLAPGNQFEFTIFDSTDSMFCPGDPGMELCDLYSFGHVRAYRMRFELIGPFSLPFSEVSIEATRVSVDSIDGLEYGLQYSTDPTDGGGWGNTGIEFTGNGSTMYIFDPTGPADTKVYRVVEL
jgi:hypothetical protein